MAPQNIQGFKYILIAKYQVYLRSVGDLSWAKEPLFVNSYWQVEVTLTINSYCFSSFFETVCKAIQKGGFKTTIFQFPKKWINVD